MENVAFSAVRKKRLGRTSSDLLVKIIDFGVADSTPEDRHRTITAPYYRSPESWLDLSWGPSTDIWSFGAIIGSLLMEPGASLLKLVGNPGGFDRLYRDLAPLRAALLELVENSGQVDQICRDLESLRALCTFVPFPPTLLSRLSPEVQEMISRLEPTVAVNGKPMTLSYLGEVSCADEGGWDFVTAAMDPDPEERPTATQLLQHPWLRI
ncbi:hypothetical protein PV10_03093 [Exophiala mesophila]|uniref:Protein kinase domain-containing protein n=1 Tax=Exophiala mesophila TaxID=212818 RepID=A0A0D1Y437_EXOME|nr:uncharacterized protein PV10_03093 [Exophiala mesophila]KIV95436.1 hypothetical protein PV10_03093 [Exophiala mesophila]